MHEKIITDLSALLHNDVPEEPKLSLFINGLTKSPQGRAFMISLFIDVKKGYLSRSAVSEIIGKIEEPEKSGRQSFGLIIEQNQNAYLCKNTQGPQSLDDNDRYVRVMTLSSFITYYLLPTYDIPDDAEGRAEAFERFFSPPPPKSKELLGKIEEYWKGHTENVWVISLNCLAEAIKHARDGKKADHVNRALALQMSPGVQVVYIRYPKPLDAVHFLKPTVLDAHFEHHPFFLSVSSEDGWGLSCACDSTTEGLVERVHKHFKGLSDGFEGFPLGMTSEKTELDFDHLTNEAERRAKHLVD